MPNAKVKALEKGSVIGGILLIAGSCIGAGMLGLPIATGVAGFFPSLCTFAIACFVMTFSGLFIVEVHQWFSGKVHFSTMVRKLLGPFGNAACWLSYLFLFYSILVAYISLSGKHFASMLRVFTGLHIADWTGSVIFVAFFGWIIYLGTRMVDMTNRVLMFFKIGVFLALLLVCIPFVQPELLTVVDIKYSLFSLPILIISFGFQNMIPTLSYYLNENTLRMRQAIVGGSLFVLFVYLLWEIIALGIIPIGGPEGIVATYHQGADAAHGLINVLQIPAIALLAQGLALFAILTSFLAQSITLVHFLEDGFKLPPRKRENIGLCLLTLVPPLVMAAIDPKIFFKAMNFAGGICAILLFGILPSLMIWVGRYHKKFRAPYKVFGGKVTPIALLLFSFFIFFYQLTQTFGWELFPKP